MKAIRVHQFGGPEVLKLDEVTDPSPGAGQVVVDAKAIGVNPVETYVREGKYGPKTFPYIPGVDAAGVVAAVGSSVTAVKPGQRVYVFNAVAGTYAEKILCDQSCVRPMPSHVGFAQGAAMGVPYGTAYRGIVIRGKGRGGEIVLIHGGSGGVGTAGIQIAKAIGLTVLATAGTDEGLQLVHQQGAHQAFNHKKEGYQKQIMEATGGKGVALIIELASHINLGHDLELLAQNGRVVVIGSRGPVEIDPRQTMKRDADIRGMSLNNADAEELRSIHAALGAGLENRSLSPVVGKEYRLAETAKAHEAIIHESAKGKMVLVP